MDFKTICRICAVEHSEMISIFQYHQFPMDNQDNCEIFKVITDCASVQIQKFDGFPEQICPSCLEYLSYAYKFKRLCEDSDYKFRNNLIVRSDVKMKTEFCEEDVKINFGESHSQFHENTEEKSKITEFEIIEVINDQCDDRIKIESNAGKDEGEVRQEELYTRVSEKPGDNQIKGVPQYKCELCEKSFTIKGSYWKHIKSHKDGKKYKCDICEKTFGTGHYLKIHTRTHTGEKPYVCDLCGKNFTENGSLNKHLLRHSRERTGERPLKCDFCEKTFTLNDNLKKHLKSHMGERYKCEFCDKKFTQNSNLKKHIRIHTGQRPFKCHFCDKRFTENGALKTHLVRHTGERYKCEFCEKTLSDRNSLSRHIKMHKRLNHFK